MKLAALSTNDPWFNHVITHGDSYVRVLKDVPLELTVFMEQVNFVHLDEEVHYRPVLHLYGRVLRIEAPYVELPHGVSSLEYPPNNSQYVDSFYHFTNSQLGELAQKGYFTEGFDVPDRMKGIEYILPAQARLVIVSPTQLDDPPVVFVEILDANSLQTDQDTSGYDLASYFPKTPENKNYLAKYGINFDKKEIDNTVRDFAEDLVLSQEDSEVTNTLVSDTNTELNTDKFDTQESSDLEIDQVIPEHIERMYLDLVAEPLSENIMFSEDDRDHDDFVFSDPDFADESDLIVGEDIDFSEYFEIHGEIKEFKNEPVTLTPSNSAQSRRATRAKERRYVNVSVEPSADLEM